MLTARKEIAVEMFVMNVYIKAFSVPENYGVISVTNNLHFATSILH